MWWQTSILASLWEFTSRRNWSSGVMSIWTALGNSIFQGTGARGVGGGGRKVSPGKNLILLTKCELIKNRDELLLCCFVIKDQAVVILLLFTTLYCVSPPGKRAKCSQRQSRFSQIFPGAPKYVCIFTAHVHPSYENPDCSPEVIAYFWINYEHYALNNFHRQDIWNWDFIESFRLPNVITFYCL